MGVFAGTIGAVLKNYQTIVNIICGAIVIIFGLNYLELIHIKIFKQKENHKKEVKGIISAFVFGIVFALNLTPCVGAFLGSALMMASASRKYIKRSDNAIGIFSGTRNTNNNISNTNKKTKNSI